MSQSVWKPNTTVAAVVAHQGRYLMVEEHTSAGLRLNQPAGHLDHGESLLAACVRETLEETGLVVVPSALLSIYQWSPPHQGDLTFLRFAYCAEVAADSPIAAGCTVHARQLSAPLPPGAVQADLDEGIVRALWLSPEELAACLERHRSPLVLQCVRDHLAGLRYPLSLVQHHD